MPEVTIMVRGRGAQSIARCECGVETKADPSGTMAVTPHLRGAHGYEDQQLTFTRTSVVICPPMESFKAVW